MEKNLLQQVTSQITAVPPGQLASYTQSLTREDQKVFDLQLRSPELSKYGETELKTVVALLISSISIITGWRIPDDEDYIRELHEQFLLKVKESYSSLNPDEIKYAFRQNSTVKDWGKVFNLILIDEVLTPYLKTRKEVNDFVASKEIRDRKLLTDNTQSDWRELCELNYQQFLTRSYNSDLWPWQMYDEFVKAGMMQDSVYIDFLEMAFNRLTDIPRATQQDKELAIEVKAEGTRHHAVIEKAKRLACRYLFHVAKERHYKNLFYETI